MRNRNRFRLKVHMAVCFCSLTLKTRACKRGNKMSHERPAVAGFNQPCSGTDSWVMQIVQVEDSGGPELGRNKRSENPCRNVPQ